MRIQDTMILAAESAAIRAELRSIFESNYNILEAANEDQLRLFLDQNNDIIAAILLDIKMTSESGAPTLAAIRDGEYTKNIPIVSIVASKSHRDEKLSIELGAYEVINYPFQPNLVKLRVVNIAAHYNEKRAWEKIVTEKTESVHRSYEVMVDSLSALIEHRSIESGQHVMRIRRFTKILLEEIENACPEYSLNANTIQAMSSASALHDIGKIAIPDAILNKPGKLTAEEYETMKTHTVTGSAMLESFKDAGNDDYMRYAYNICRYHHERWDGGGYPDGLAGDDIPICAQVVGLVDAYDALTTDRVYKKAIPYLDASNMIINGECGVFSPKLLECFKNVRGIFEELAHSYADGYSPKSDSITVPLPPPKKATGDSLQAAITKYHALLHHFDIAAMEVELDTGAYHLIYDPYLDLETVRSENTFFDAMRALADRIVHPDDRSMVIDNLERYINTFFESGQRKTVRYYRMRGSDGIYRKYEVVIIRIKTGDDDERRAVALWRRLDIYGQEHTRQICEPVDSEFVIEQSCIYNKELTLEVGVERFANVLGYTAEEFKKEFNRSLAHFIDPDRKEKIMNQLSEQLKHSKITELIIPFVRKDGSKTHFLARGRLFSDEMGIERISGVFCNCDGLRVEHETMISSLALYRTIVEKTGDILFEWNIAADKISCSPRFRERFGYEPISENATENISTRSHIHPDDIDLFKLKVKEVQTDSSVPFVEFPIRFANSDGKYLWNRMRITVIRDENGEPLKLVGLIVDIDYELRHSQSLLDRAERDSLTKMLNKDACRRKVEYHLEENKKSGALIIIDLDNFKEINDRFGHMFGDAVLVNLSEEIIGMFREGDVVGRIGGDEFLVFMSDVTNRTLIKERCDDLIRNVRALYDESTSGFSLSCSVGAALSTEHGMNYSELFQQADIALYQSKTGGKGICMLYDTDMERPEYASNVSLRIDSDERLGIADNSLVEYVFQRLYDTSDIESTINSIFELVGKQMNVSRLYIFENNDENTTCSNTFEWCNEGITPEKDWLQNIEYATMIPDYDKLFNERGIFYCADVTKLPDHIREILEPQGVRSMLQCAIRDKGVFRGYIGIDECTKLRMWTKEQIDLLTFLSQMVSVFLLKKRAQERTEDLNADLRKVLETQYAWVYVIDSESYELKFLNGRVLDVAPDAKKGEPCYKALMGNDVPCKTCPIKLNDGKGGTCLIQNEYLDLKVNATAAPIHWDGKKEWLITCREADK